MCIPCLNIVILILTFILKIFILDFAPDLGIQMMILNVTIFCIDYSFGRSVKCQSLNILYLIYCFPYQNAIIHAIYIRAMYTWLLYFVFERKCIFYPYMSYLIYIVLHLHTIFYSYGGE